MGAQTGIEWTDATWNPVGGCDIHTPGCTNCYAMTIAASGRLRGHPVYDGTTTIVKGKPVWNGKLTRLPDDHKGWAWPITWRGAKKPVMGPGKPSLIFVGDMSDLFHKDRPRDDIDRTIAGIIYSRHIGQLLTKRADVMAQYFAELELSGRWLPRLWCGASVERQQEADQRRDYLRVLSKLGFTTFVSYEPALGPVDWAGWTFVNQIISGGESGPEARPSHPDWHSKTRDWCETHNVSYFFKQWGEWAPIHEDTLPEDMSSVCTQSMTVSGARSPLNLTDSIRIGRVGKSRAGRLLDGIEHNGFPEVT